MEKGIKLQILKGKQNSDSSSAYTERLCQDTIIDLLKAQDKKICKQRKELKTELKKSH